MKISKLKLKHIKCFKNVEISFENKNWSLVVGDNGDGKTTILRSIAAGLCDTEGVSALLAELYGGFLRKGEEEGSIEVTLTDEDDNNKEYSIKTSIKSEEGNGESVEQGGKIDREKLFAVAYGARRAVTGTEAYEEYALVDSVYSLFNYGYSLHNAELGARRVKAEGKWADVKHILEAVLMLKPQDEIGLDKRGLYVECDRWGKVYVNALSDGYKALTSVILDFLVWNLLNTEVFDIRKLSGIFIIDEIEQHLHPKWQRAIIRILAEQFPNMQFICSTHTPICALGLSDLDDLKDLKYESQLIKVGYVNGYSKAESINLKEEYVGYRYDQILSSDIFNLSGTRSASIEKKLKEYRDIYIKNENERNDDEKQRLKDIKDELKDLPMWDNMEDIETRRELIALLKSKKEGGKENDKD